MADRDKPFGLREVDITKYNADGTLGAPVRLNASQTLTFKPKKQTKKLKGDDRTIDQVTYDHEADWSIDNGGIPLDAWAILSGGTVSTTGVSPNEVKTLVKKATDVEPYFRIRGRAVNSNGGLSDTVVTLHYCKATSGPEGELKGEEYFITKCAGEAIGHPDTDEVWSVAQRETAAALA